MMRRAAKIISLRLQQKMQDAPKPVEEEERAERLKG